MPAISARGLTKRYRSGDSEFAVFSALDLDIEKGESVALTGESGAGKSTLLHLLGGLDRPSEGAIYFGQTDICRLSGDELADFRNRKLGFVWQIHSLLPEFTALENVMMPLLLRQPAAGRFKGQAREEAEPLARASLEEVGLAHRATHRSGELSGGEQQRIALARALVTRPEVLLADEPTGSLDHRTGAMTMDLIGDLQRSRSLSFLHVTHNPAFARRASRVLSLEGGRLLTSSAYSSDSHIDRATHV